MKLVASKREVITLLYPEEGYARSGAVPMFEPGQRLRAAGYADGVERDWRVVSFDWIRGELVVEPWS